MATLIILFSSAERCSGSRHLTLGTAPRTVKTPRCRRAPPAELARERPRLRGHDRAVAGRRPGVAPREHTRSAHTSHHRTAVIEDRGCNGCRAGDALGMRDRIAAPADAIKIRVERGGARLPRP